MLRLKGNRKTRRYLKKVLRRVSNTRLNKLIKSPKTFANFLSKFGLILTFSSNIAFANPEGGIVVEGDASITTPSENYMQIDQSSQKAIIDWQDFSIDVEEHTHFEQPNSSSTTLNRVVTNLPSEIFGKLSGTGKVMLINQNGIFFGEGAQVDLNGLVASSADISNQDFLDGNYNFNISGSPDAEIKNDGQINISDGGVVALVAPKVSNNGFINAKLGKITLAATDKWILDAGGMVKMVVDEDIVVQLVQSGHIQADGGMIQLSAAAVQGMLSTVVNVSGVTRAQSASVDNSGNIILYAGDSAGNVGGTIEVTGTLDVSGDGIGETGGAIHIAAERISVSDGANIDASGYSGGGEVLIGGDYKGGDYRGTLDINDDGRGGTSSVNQTKVSEAMEAFYYSIMGIPTASKVYMGFDTSIDVSADYQGNAGRTILWADDLTKYYGTIIARGGQLSGDGGFIETSGGILEAAGFVDTVALNGVNGTWLLDPYNITITSADNNTSNDGGSPNTFSASGTSATIDSATLVTALEGGNNVVVTTAGGGAEDGDITVTSDISSSSINSDVSLSLEAHRNIDINGGVDISAAGSSNKLDITLNADTDAMGGGAIIIGDGATDTILNSNGGDIVIGGGADPSTTAAIGNTDGSTDIGVHVDQAQILAGDGNISIIGEGEGTNDNNYGVYIEGGSTIKTTYTGASTTQGNIDITGTGGDGGATNRGVYINGGSTTITVVDGDININGTGGTQTGNDSDGIRINTSTVSSTGTGTNAGTITLIGASGDSASQSDGINIRGTVTSEDGDITITGTSPGTYSGNRNIGVYLDFEANVESTGTTADAADITITGTGGDAGGNGNNGFRLYGSSDAKVTTIAGDISITGTGDGAGTNNDGVRIHSTATGSIASTGSGNITLEGSEVGSGSGEGIYFESGNTATVGDATMTGDITFIADTINIEAGTIKTTGNYILQTKTAGTDINISNTTTGGLDLSTTELAFFDQTINSGWGLYAHDNILIDDDADLTSAASEAGGFSLYADTDSTGSGTITLGDGTGSTDIGNSTHTGDITLQADNLIMNAASLDTDGSFILKTRTADTDINISNTTTGGFDLSLTELAFFDQTDNTGWNLVAHGDILIDDGADLTTQSGGLGIVINSDSDETSGGAIRIGDNGGDFSVLTSNGSDITLGGGADPTTTAAIGSTDGTYDIGVNFDEAKILSGDGNITIIGEGDSSNSDNYGVYIGNDSVVQTTYAGASTTEGNIKITGTGGAGAFSNTAVRIVGNSQITTDDGDITITGTGGASTDWDNEGILIDGGSDIISTGGGDDAGNITLVGTGGTGVNRNQGLFINGASTSITTVDGDIYIKGTGTGTGAASHGILLWSGLDTGILSSGLGNITLEGIESTNSEGIVFEPGNSLTIGGSSMKGDITLLADLVALDAGTLDTDGSFIIKTRTADTDINITNSFTSGVWIPLSQFAFFDQTDNTGWNLVAHGDILIEDGADLTTQSGGLGIVINSDFDETNGGAIRIGDNGGDFSVLTSNGSNITLGGGADPTTTAAIGSTDGTYDIGVNLDEAKILSGDGNITIIGEGEGTNDDNYGIYIQNGSKIQTTYTGALTTQGNIDLTGTGGDGGLNNRGVYILNSGSIITVVDGDIDITGTGGDQTGIDSSGVRLQIGTISSTGTGSNAGEITVTGNTGNSTSNSEGVIIRDALVTSVDGDITLTGTSPSTYSGTGNNGVRIQFAGVVSSTGATADAANITITGTAGNGTNNNFGLRTSDSGSKVTTIVGDISITGTGNGSGSNNSGIYLEGNLDEGILSTGVGNITLEGIEGTGGQGIYFEAGNTATIGGSSMTGDITLTADTVDLSALSVRTTGNTTVQTENDSTTMGLGDSSTGTLNLTDTELGFFHTDIDTLTFGNGTVDGATDVRAATWNSNVVFQTDSGVITFNGDQNAGTNDITITSNALTALNSAVTFTGGIVTLDTLDADSNTLNVNADSLITQTIANVGDTTFTVDALDLAGALSGQGAGDAFVLEGKTNSTTIGIGTGATGDLQLADAEVTNIGSGWDSVTLGKSTGTGAMQVNAATWADDIILRTDSGIITLLGAQTFNNNDFTVNTSASFDTVANITDGGDVNITAGSITGGDNITATSLTTNTTGDTTIGDISLGAGTLDINADNLIIGDVTSGTTTIDSKGNLTIGAFTPASATVTFDSDNTGSATANISSIVGGLTIDGGSSVGNVLNVTGTISAGAEDLDFTAETINLQDDVAANKVDISGKDITATGTITAPTINFVNTGTIIADIVSTAVDISGIKTTLTGTVDGGVDQAAANKINKITTPSIDSEYIFNTFIIGATASPPAPAPTPSPTPSPSPDPTPSPSPTPSVPSLESSLNYDIEKIKQYPIKIEEFDSITYKTKKVTNLESDYFNSIPTIEKVDGQALKELMLQQEGLVTNPKFGIQNEVNSQNDNIDDEVDE
jgi:filamentous hemagglutinin family protein